MRKLASNTIELLKSMDGEPSGFGSIDNPKWHGFSGRKHSLSSCIRNGYIQISSYNNHTVWSITDKGRDAIGSSHLAEAFIMVPSSKNIFGR